MAFHLLPTFRPTSQRFYCLLYDSRVVFVLNPVRVNEANIKFAADLTRTIIYIISANSLHRLVYIFLVTGHTDTSYRLCYKMTSCHFALRQICAIHLEKPQLNKINLDCYTCTKWLCIALFYQKHDQTRRLFFELQLYQTISPVRGRSLAGLPGFPSSV